MRRTHRYTIAYPEPIRTSELVYGQKFREFPFWYRLYLRLRGLIVGASPATMARRHHLAELRRRLEAQAPQIVDPSTPALLGEFHLRLRNLEARLSRIAPALDEATGTRRGEFARDALGRLAPELAEEVASAARVTEALLADGSRSIDEIRRRVEITVSRRLDELVTEIDHVLSPIWLALRSLDLLGRVEVESLLPIGGAPAGRTPLRIVEKQVRQLAQTIELCRRMEQPQATSLAFAFAASRLRSQPGSATAAWQEIDEFDEVVPLADLARLANNDPFLELPPLELKSDWWNAFHAACVQEAGRAVAPVVLDHRTRTVQHMLADSFLIDRPAPVWIPAQLLPRTTGLTLLLATSESFHETRRAVTQLVIDASFYHLDVRNQLHQQALEVDGALDRLRTMFGVEEDRGTLGEEIRRLQSRAGVSAVVHRQLVALAERYRPRVIQTIDTLTTALAEAGRTVEQTVHGESAAFDLKTLPHRPFAGTATLRELLDQVAGTWPTLAISLRALMRAEESS